MRDAILAAAGSAVPRRSWQTTLAAAVTPRIAAVMAFGLLAATVLAATLAGTGGVLVYSLDDPYIHLALAERLARGHYGINVGEITSPSSSVIWPFLLIPGVGSAIHPWLPLILNLALGAATAALLGLLAERVPLAGSAHETRLTRIGLAVLLVVATNLVGLAFTGMEHNLQVFLAVAAGLGLVRALEDERLPWWAIAAAAAGPAVRYEMLAITAAIGLVLLFERRWRDIVVLGVASLALPVALAVFLMANGVAPLPNSVLLKLTTGQAAEGMPFPFNVLLPRRWNANLSAKLAMWVVIAGLAVAAWTATQGRARVACAAAAVAGLLHMALGQFGWFYRYEVYALAFCLVPVVWLMAAHLPRHLLLALLPVAGIYAAALIKSPTASTNTYEQQLQMHRFVTEHYRQPFAVNDLGWVSYRIDPSLRVLDLWGLASNEALAHARDRSAVWLDDITRRNGAGLAMIYDAWFPERPASWRKVATLTLASRQITPGSADVAFYATGAGDADAIRAQLEAFRASLPPGVKLQILPTP